jgi:hypothetical protein
VIRALAGFFVAFSALCALIGVVVAAIRGDDHATAVAWALWLGGAFLILVVGGSGSTSQMSGGARAMPGSAYVFWGSANALPQTPWVFIPIGVLVIGLGVAVYVL